MLAVRTTRNSDGCNATIMISTRMRARAISIVSTIPILLLIGLRQFPAVTLPGSCVHCAPSLKIQTAIKNRGKHALCVSPRRKPRNETARRKALSSKRFGATDPPHALCFLRRALCALPLPHWPRPGDAYSSDRNLGIFRLAAGDGAHNHKRRGSCRDCLGQQRVRRFVRQILLAGEESYEGPALLRHLVTDRAAQHRIARLE